MGRNILKTLSSIENDKIITYGVNNFKYLSLFVFEFQQIKKTAFEKKTSNKGIGESPFSQQK